MLESLQVCKIGLILQGYSIDSVVEVMTAENTKKILGLQEPNQN